MHYRAFKPTAPVTRKELKSILLMEPPFSAQKHMQVLTVRQPWAQRIVEGKKRIENRTWSQGQHTFAVLIHAALKRSGTYPLSDLCRLDTLPYGAIIGFAVCRGWLTRENAARLYPEEFELRGPKCWELTNATAFPTPVPCKGRLGLWPLLATGPDGPGSVIQAVREQIRAVLRREVA